MMKKSISLLLAAILLFSLSLSVSASSPWIYDDAGILSQEEYDSLQQEAEAISDRYDFGVYIVTIDNYQDLEVSDSIETTAKEVYETMEFGAGDRHAGILLMLSMDNRKYAIYCDGDTEDAFDGIAHDYLSGEFLDEFGDDDWYGGFLDYLSGCDYILEMAEDGVTLENNPPHARLYGVIACILLGFLVALIVTLILKSQLTSVHTKTDAAGFVAKGGLNLSRRQDIFTHITETRVYDPEKNESSSDSDSDSSSSSGSF